MENLNVSLRLRVRTGGRVGVPGALRWEARAPQTASLFPSCLSPTSHLRTERHQVP